MGINRTMLTISCAICLLPIILSIVLYNDLPEQVAIHWNNEGIADNFAPRAVAAYGLPFFFVAVNIFVWIRLYNDPRSANASKVMRGISAWTAPCMSLILVPITLFRAIGIDIPIALIAPVIVGFLVILTGNYLPKSRQNYTIGIRLPWTLSNTDNWNKTHRMAGFVWILGGIAIVIGSFVFFERSFLSVFVMSVMATIVVIPFFYSFWLYKTGRELRR